MSTELTLIIVLVILLIVISTIIIGGFYLLHKGIKEQYVYNHTALPSLAEEKEEQEKEEEQYQFESILSEKPSKKADWSDFHGGEIEDTVLPEVNSTPDTTDENITRRTIKQANSLPDLS